MEEIVIPNISGIISEARNIIDLTATLADYLNLKCIEKDLVQTISAVKNVLTKLAQLQGPHDESATDGPSFLVKEIAMVTKDIIDKKLSTRFIKRMKSKIVSVFPRCRRMKTRETIDDNLRRALEEKKRHLFKLTKDHVNLVEEIRKSQKSCDISRSRKNKAELSLYAYLLKRNAGQIDGDTKTRDLAIQELQISLAIEQGKQDINDLTFQKLIIEEERLCPEIEKISQEIRVDITTVYTKRWEQAVIDMKHLVEKMLPGESHASFLEKIKELDIQAILMKIMTKDEFYYKTGNFEEFKRVNILKEIKGRC